MFTGSSFWYFDIMLKLVLAGETYNKIMSQRTLEIIAQDASTITFDFEQISYS